MPMFPKIVDTLGLSMKAANVRHQVLANNIANVNVPRFQGFQVDFEERLKEALKAPSPSDEILGATSHPRHIPIHGSGGPPTPPEPRIVPLVAEKMRQDGNNVDVEDQMAKLAANQLWYQALVRSVSDEFGRLRTAITEGRR